MTTPHTLIHIEIEAFFALDAHPSAPRGAVMHLEQKSHEIACTVTLPSIPHDAHVIFASFALAIYLFLAVREPVNTLPVFVWLWIGECLVALLASSFRKVALVLDA